MTHWKHNPQPPCGSPQFDIPVVVSLDDDSLDDEVHPVLLELPVSALSSPCVVPVEEVCIPVEVESVVAADVSSGPVVVSGVVEPDDVDVSVVAVDVVVIDPVEPMATTH